VPVEEERLMFAQIHASSLTVLTWVVALNVSAGLTPILAQCEVAKLVAGNGSLGISVAIDGDTDQADLGLLLTHWGEGC
jgi:hypothetical protein